MRNVDTVDKCQSSSEDSDMENDSWHFLGDGFVSQAYRNFVAKHVDALRAHQGTLLLFKIAKVAKIYKPSLVIESSVL